MDDGVIILPSSLPTEQSKKSKVQDFGWGPFDSEEGSEDDSYRAEDAGHGQSLPDDGGSNISGPENYYSYGMINQSDDMWATEGGPAASSKLPGVSKNEDGDAEIDIPGGNSWSGYRVEDNSRNRDNANSIDCATPIHISSTHFSMIRAEWEKKMDEAMKIEQEDSRSSAIEALFKKMPDVRTATNLGLVSGLTREFIKEFGKKDLTRRHVMAFLEKINMPQYLSSDVIRCLKLRHSIYVKDVLDEFPIRLASSRVMSHLQPQVASVRDQLIDLEISNIRIPEVASVLRRCAADMSQVLVDLEKCEVSRG